MTEYYEDDLDFEDEEELSEEEIGDLILEAAEEMVEEMSEESDENMAAQVAHVDGEIGRIERELGRRLTEPERTEVITSFVEAPDERLDASEFAFDARDDSARGRYSAQVAQDAINATDDDSGTDYWQGGFGPPSADE